MSKTPILKYMTRWLLEYEENYTEFEEIIELSF